MSSLSGFSPAGSALRSTHGSRFAIAAGHPTAAQAGQRVFLAGGNVFDAALAASAALCVALPHATGIGGDLLCLIRDGRTGAVHGLDAAGVASRHATSGEFAAGMPRRGIRAAVVPGIVSGWQALHQRFGGSSWANLFAAAIELAEEGMPASRGFIQFRQESEGILAADAGCTKLFLQGDTTASVEQTERLQQPTLAKTLRRLATQGPQDFYQGETAAAFGRFMRGAGGLIDTDDLAAYRARWVQPLCAEHHHHDVWVLPPSSFGLLLPLQLSAFHPQPHEGGGNPAARRLSTQLRAMRAAFDVGLPWVYDGAPVDQTRLGILRREVAARLHAGAAPRERHGGTACVVAGDASGNAVVLVQSIYQPFGAACADAATGILLNNRMYAFSANPTDPNVVSPGKRPAHTLCPVLVEMSGQARWALASPGGISQTATLAQVIGALIDEGVDAAQAVARPRWCLSREGHILIEPAHPGYSDSLRDEFALTQREDPYAFGSAKAVAWCTDGQLQAAADPRRDAAGAAV